MMKNGDEGVEKLETYRVSVNFAGFVGADMEYEVEAYSYEEAEEEALRLAFDDLSVSGSEVVEYEPDEDWERYRD